MMMSAQKLFRLKIQGGVYQCSQNFSFVACSSNKLRGERIPPCPKLVGKASCPR